MLATYVRGGSLTHVREPPVPYWTTQRLQAYRVPTPRSSAWRPPATQAVLVPPSPDHPLRHAASLRATDGRYGNGAATRERLPPVPAAVLEVSVSSCASGSAPSPGAAVRCGAGGCNRFCSCLTSKEGASQPASQPGRQGCAVRYRAMVLTGAGRRRTDAAPQSYSGPAPSTRAPIWDQWPNSSPDREVDLNSLTSELAGG